MEPGARSCRVNWVMTWRIASPFWRSPSRCIATGREDILAYQNAAASARVACMVAEPCMAYGNQAERGSTVVRLRSNLVRTAQVSA